MPLFPPHAGPFAALDRQCVLVLRTRELAFWGSSVFVQKQGLEPFMDRPAGGGARSLTK